jgi:hypothetical protein
MWLYPLAQASLAEAWHQPQTMRTQATFLVSWIFKQKKYIRMQAPARNETDWMRQTWEFNSSATVVLAPAGLPLHKSCRVVSNNFWNSFNFWSGASAESQLNRFFLYYLPRRPVELYLFYLRSYSDVHELTMLAIACTQLPSNIASVRQAESAWQWFRVCPADSGEGRTSLSGLVLNLTA